MSDYGIETYADLGVLTPTRYSALSARRCMRSRFSGGHFGCFLSPDLSACVPSPHSAFICATYRELTFMPCVFWT